MKNGTLQRATCLPFIDSKGEARHIGGVPNLARTYVPLKYRFAAVLTSSGNHTPRSVRRPRSRNGRMLRNRTTTPRPRQ